MIGLPQLPPRGNRPEPTPNQKAQALTGRPYVSFSEISSFQRCPASWHFAYVEKAPKEQISAALILGTGVHAAVEAHFQALLAGEPQPTTAELMHKFDECWAKETQETPVTFSKGQDAATTRQTAERIIDAFLANPLAHPEGQLLGLEESFKIRVAYDLPDLAGRVDVLTHTPGELLVTDLKTARSTWTSDTAQEHADQLVIYGLGMADLAKTMDSKVKLRFIVLTKTKETKIEAVPVEINEDRVKRTKLVIRRVVEAMNSGAIYPNPSPINCSTCPYQQRCERWHRGKNLA